MCIVCELFVPSLTESSLRERERRGQRECRPPSAASPATETTCTYVVVVALDHFDEHRGTILHVFGEYLQQVAILVVVDQDLQLLQNLQVLFDLHLAAGESQPQKVVVRVRHGEKLDAARAEALYGRNNVVGVEGDVLDAGAAVVLDIFGDLGLPLARGRLVDRYFNRLLVICHHNRTQCRIIGMYLGIVDRPEAMKLQFLLVPLARYFHFIVWLIANNVINKI